MKHNVLAWSQCGNFRSVMEISSFGSSNRKRAWGESSMAKCGFGEDVNGFLESRSLAPRVTSAGGEEAQPIVPGCATTRGASCLLSLLQIILREEREALPLQGRG